MLEKQVLRRIQKYVHPFRITNGKGFRLKDFDPDAVAARDLRVDPFQNQHFAIEAHHLAIFDTGIGTRADIGLAFDVTLDDHFLRLWIVVPEHENVTARRAINEISLGALISCRHYGASAILIPVICGQPPASHNVVWTQAGRHRNRGHRRWRR
jgi:hypothetical protein